MTGGELLKIYLGLLLALILQSCGGGGNSGTVDSILLQSVNHEPEILAYEGCYDPSFNEFQNSISALWKIGGRERNVNVSLSSYPNVPGLSDARQDGILDNIYTNGIFTAEFNVDFYTDNNDEFKDIDIKQVNGGGELLFGTHQIVKAPKLLTLCEGKDYANQTADKKAISLLAPLAKSHKFAKDALGKNPLRVSFYINSEISEILHAKEINIESGKVIRRMEVTNHNTLNAYWTTDEKSKKRYIVFLPHPKLDMSKNEDVKLSQMPHFWKFPFVIAHEYGHHILADAVYNSSSLEMRKALSSNNKVYSACGDYKHSHQMISQRTKDILDLEKKNEELDSIYYKLVIGAFNEGFADTFAHLALEGKHSDLTYENCFLGKQNRTITASFFSNGVSKRFDIDNIKQFISAIEVEKDEDDSEVPGEKPEIDYCDSKPNLKDPHDFGAILAYVTNQLFAHGLIDSASGLKFLYHYAKGLSSVTLFSTFFSHEKVATFNLYDPNQKYIKAFNKILIDYLNSFKTYFARPFNVEQCKILKASFGYNSEVRPFVEESCTPPVVVPATIPTN
jgi:hypothetical protein